jgi:hypothetical protein
MTNRPEYISLDMLGLFNRTPKLYCKTKKLRMAMAHITGLYKSVIVAVPGGVQTLRMNPYKAPSNNPNTVKNRG